MYEYKELKHEGNDCKIYKTVSLQPLGSLWAVVTLERNEGSWVASDNMNVSITEVGTYYEMKKIYDAIEY